MPIADPLPEVVQQRWSALAQPDEAVTLAVASDVTASGAYGQRWLVITDKRVVVLPDLGAPWPAGTGTNGHAPATIPGRARPSPRTVTSPWPSGI